MISADHYEHAKIFKTIVAYGETGDPHIGDLITYALYKEAKVEWVGGFIDEHGRSPNHEELKAYQFTIKDRNIEAFRRRADLLLETYAEVYFAESIEFSREQAWTEVENAEAIRRIRELTGQVAELKTQVGQPKFLSGVGASVVGTVIVALLVWSYFRTKWFWDAVAGQ